LDGTLDRFEYLTDRVRRLSVAVAAQSLRSARPLSALGLLQHLRALLLQLGALMYQVHTFLSIALRHECLALRHHILASIDHILAGLCRLLRTLRRRLTAALVVAALLLIVVLAMMVMVMVVDHGPKLLAQRAGIHAIRRAYVEVETYIFCSSNMHRHRRLLRVTVPVTMEFTAGETLGQLVDSLVATKEKRKQFSLFLRK
jgi:hypothetical protein